MVSQSRSYSSPEAGHSTGGAPTMCSTVQRGARSPSRARTSSRMSPSVVPGSVRQSTSITASPGMTLYLIPAWIVPGLMVSRRSARTARAYMSSHSRLTAASARRGSSSEIARARAAASGGRAASIPSSRARIGAVMRGSPGEARRRIASAARTIALSSRGHRAVAPRAVDRDPVGLAALLGGHDRVEAAAGQVHGHAARLVERAGGQEHLGPVVHQPLDALRAACLLVGGAREQDVAAEAGDRVAGRVEAGGTGAPREQRHDHELHRDHRLHVHGAATPDVAVGDLRRERRVRPAGRRPPGPRRGARGGAVAHRPYRHRAAGRPRCLGPAPTR